MKEVEIKIEVQDLGVIRKRLESLGCVFSDPLNQEDSVYLPKSVPKEEWDRPASSEVNVLRVRRQNNKAIFTLKRNSRDNFLAKIEKEMEIGSPEIMEEIIELLGFTLVCRVKKQRIKCQVGEFEICLDTVEGLGSFLEMEKMTNEDPALVQQAMMAKLSEWGIDASKRMSFGYDILLLQKQRLSH